MVFTKQKRQNDISLIEDSDDGGENNVGRESGAGAISALQSEWIEIDGTTNSWKKI